MPLYSFPIPEEVEAVILDHSDDDSLVALLSISGMLRKAALAELISRYLPDSTIARISSMNTNVFLKGSVAIKNETSMRILLALLGSDWYLPRRIVVESLNRSDGITEKLLRGALLFFKGITRQTRCEGMAPTLSICTIYSGSSTLIRVMETAAEAGAAFIKSHSLSAFDTLTSPTSSPLNALEWRSWPRSASIHFAGGIRSLCLRPWFAHVLKQDLEDIFWQDALCTLGFSSDLSSVDPLLVRGWEYIYRTMSCPNLKTLHLDGVIYNDSLLACLERHSCLDELVFGQGHITNSELLAHHTPSNLCIREVWATESGLSWLIKNGVCANTQHLFLNYDHFSRPWKCDCLEDVLRFLLSSLICNSFTILLNCADSPVLEFLRHIKMVTTNGGPSYWLGIRNLTFTDESVDGEAFEDANLSAVLAITEHFPNLQILSLEGCVNSAGRNFNTLKGLLQERGCRLELQNIIHYPETASII